MSEQEHLPALLIAAEEDAERFRKAFLKANEAVSAREEEIDHLRSQIFSLYHCLDAWRADDHNAVACQDFGCKACVVVACDFDIRAALEPR